jgi:hypothetical protein
MSHIETHRGPENEIEEILADVSRQLRARLEARGSWAGATVACVLVAFMGEEPNTRLITNPALSHEEIRAIYAQLLGDMDDVPD